MNESNQPNKCGQSRVNAIQRHYERSEPGWRFIVAPIVTCGGRPPATFGV